MDDGFRIDPESVGGRESKRLIVVILCVCEPAPPPVQSIKTINVKHVNGLIVQVHLSGGSLPSSSPPAHTLPRALHSGSALQGGSPQIDLLHIAATLITHSSPHRVEG